MNGSRLKKLNGADTSAAVENDILGAGYAPFEEGALEGLAAMEIFKARGRRTRRRKKEDGKYVRLYLYSSPESAASSADTYISLMTLSVVTEERRSTPFVSGSSPL